MDFRASFQTWFIVAAATGTGSNAHSRLPMLISAMTQAIGHGVPSGKSPPDKGSIIRRYGSKSCSQSTTIRGRHEVWLRAPGGFQRRLN